MTTTCLNTEVTVELVPITCDSYGCGVTFALDAEFVRARREDHKSWFCPNGHSRYYPSKSETEKLRSELEAARRIAQNERDWRRGVQEERDRAERRRAAAQGQVTKIKRRVGKGVCPCCNRSFADLARHMAGKHPEYAEDAS